MRCGSRARAPARAATPPERHAPRPRRRRPSLLSVVLQVFEFLDSDLEAVIKARNIVLGPEHVKSYMQVGQRGRVGGGGGLEGSTRHTGLSPRPRTWRGFSLNPTPRHGVCGEPCQGLVRLVGAGPAAGAGLLPCCLGGAPRREAQQRPGVRQRRVPAPPAMLPVWCTTVLRSWGPSQHTPCLPARACCDGCGGRPSAHPACPRLRSACCTPQATSNWQTLDWPECSAPQTRRSPIRWVRGGGTHKPGATLLPALCRRERVVLVWCTLGRQSVVMHGRWQHLSRQ